MTDEAREQFEEWIDAEIAKGNWDKSVRDSQAIEEVFRAGRQSGLEAAARIVRARKEKHSNLLSKNVLEMAADEIELVVKKYEAPPKKEEP